MDNKKFEQLINKEDYQVFLFRSPCSFPVIFVSHLWFVVNKKGVLSRWEVTHHKIAKGEKNWGHIVLNFLPPFSGLRIIPFYARKHFKAQLLGNIESGENGVAGRIINFIENSPNTYKYRDTYHFIGPNSNTYAEWVLGNFKEFQVMLPRNALGKNHKIKS